MSPVDYHGWTHAPKEAGGTDPIPVTASPSIIPVFTARQQSAFTTLVDGNDTALLWDQWDTGYDTTVFDKTLSASKVSTVKLLKLPGLYSFTCGIQWAVNWSGNARIILSGDYDENNEQDFVARAGGWTGNITAHFTLVMEAPFETTDGLAAVQWQAVQHSGVNRDTDLGTFMQIAYLGEVDAGGF